MGVLSGYKVVEMAGLGPCPLAGMLLADMGAEVIRVDRSTRANPMYAKDMSARGKKSVVLDIKTEVGREALLKLVESADVLIEGYRPGVVEKLGIGPEQCWAVNPKLVYGRMTGWGQTGPLAKNAGHDLNYIALTGALHGIGRPGERPTVPLNLIGDFGGGTMFLISGVLGALLERERSGKGQVVDAAMIDGTANLMNLFHSFHNAGCWDVSDRGVNLLDGGAFFYDTYETADGKYIALGSIEPQFFTELVERAGLDKERFNIKTQYDQSQWSDNQKVFAEVFKTKTREQWCELLENSDACFTPVLDINEAPQHPHNQARNAYIEVDGKLQPAPAPRFSRTPSEVKHGQHALGEDTRSVLTALGYSDDKINDMKSSGIVAW